MALDSADTMPVQQEGVQGSDAGAQKLAMAFRKKKKKSAPPMPAPQAGGGY